MNLLLFEVTTAHEAYSQTTPLPLVLGDGYLYVNNRVCRNIREALLFFGYEFTSDDFCHYGSVPFTSLPDILAQKRIPYRDTASGLLKIENTRPKSILMRDIDAQLRNPILHEAGHCVAEQLLPPLESGDELSETDAKLIRTMIAEAFAIAAEVSAWSSNQTQLDIFFFEQNSYIRAPAWGKMFDAMNLARSCMIAYGYSIVFKLIVLSSMHHLFLRNEVDRGTFERCLAIAAPGLRFGAEDLNRLEKVFQIYFLDNGRVWTEDQGGERFRRSTARFYLNYALGEDPDSIERLPRIDFLTHVEKNDALLGRLDLLTDITENGLNGVRGSILKKHRPKSR